MELKNCPKCGKMFTYTGASVVCEKCVKKDEEKYLELKEYINENPEQNMAQVAKATGVPTRKILHYIQEGRIILATGSAMASEVSCEKCGKPISGGKYCDSCAEKVSKNMAAALPTKEEPKLKMSNNSGSPKMHTRK